MYRSLLLIYVAVSAATLTACSFSLDQTVPNPFQFNSFENIGEAQKFLENSEIKCSDENCPDSMVGVFVLEKANDKTNIRACSGTLISSDQVLTDQSCLPDDLRQENTLCQGRIRLIFSRTRDFPEQHMECTQIENLPSNIENDTSYPAPSWAILKMSQSPGRSPRALSENNGLSEADAVSLYSLTFDFSQGKPIGVIQHTECLANTNHYSSLLHIGPTSSLFDLSDCSNKLESAAPGAGIINGEGKLAGLLNFVKSMQTNKLTALDSNNEALLSQQTFHNAGGATQTACIPGVQGEVHDLCEFDENYQDRALVYRDILSQRHHPDFLKTHNDIDGALSKLTSQKIKWVEWTLVTSQKLEIASSQSSQEDLLKIYQLENRYPFIPDCFDDDTLPDDFFIDGFKRSRVDQELLLPGDSLRRVLPSQVEPTRLQATKSGEKTYKVQLDLDVSLTLGRCHQK